MTSMDASNMPPASSFGYRIALGVESAGDFLTTPARWMAGIKQYKVENIKEVCVKNDQDWYGYKSEEIGNEQHKTQNVQNVSFKKVQGWDSVSKVKEKPYKANAGLIASCALAVFSLGLSVAFGVGLKRLALCNRQIAEKHKRVSEVEKETQKIEKENYIIVTETEVPVAAARKAEGYRQDVDGILGCFLCCIFCCDIANQAGAFDGPY